jgi:8-hydroxy-5-deazaflavin:NADPH oxidoreductase
VKIAVLGTGTVGRTIAGKLREVGHDVTVGSRTAAEDAVTFADAAAGAELVFNCTAGTASLEALEAAGADKLDGKPLLDVANALDFSQGMPPSLAIVNTDSLGERIQAAFPGARVVKTLNTVNAGVMVDPGSVPGEHVVFVCGDDDGDRVARRAWLAARARDRPRRHRRGARHRDVPPAVATADGRARHGAVQHRDSALNCGPHVSG